MVSNSAMLFFSSMISGDRGSTRKEVSTLLPNCPPLGGVRGDDDGAGLGRNEGGVGGLAASALGAAAESTRGEVGERGLV